VDIADQRLHWNLPGTGATADSFPVVSRPAEVIGEKAKEKFSPKIENVSRAGHRFSFRNRKIEQEETKRTEEWYQVGLSTVDFCSRQKAQEKTENKGCLINKRLLFTLGCLLFNLN
jgi:hypothetical protein